MIQTLFAVNEVTKQIIQQNSDFFPMKPLEYSRLLIISIGTGTAKHEEKFNAEIAGLNPVHTWLISIYLLSLKLFNQKIIIFEFRY